MPFIPNLPSSASAMQTAQSEVFATDLDILVAADNGSGVVAGCAVTFSSGLTFAVAAGAVVSLGRAYLPVQATSVTLGAQDATNPRLDLIVVAASGTPTVRAGAAAAAPVPPALTGGDVALGTVYVPASGTALSSANLVAKAIPVGDGSGHFAAPNYGLVPARRMTDGSSTASSTTFTSASAAFTAADVGRQVYITNDVLSNQGFVTRIASVTNATTVVLAHAPTSTHTAIEFYVGDPQQAAIQAAIDAAAAAGGGRVDIPEGAYPITAKLILKNRVTLAGAGMRATLLWLGMTANTVGVGDTMIQNYRGDPTLGGSAEYVGVRDLFLDGGKARQKNTTTLTANVLSGDTTITVSSTANFPAASTAQPAALVITDTGGQREIVHYTAKTATTFTVGVRNAEATGSAGLAFATATATVATYGHAIWFEVNPLFPVQKPLLDDDYDVHSLVFNVQAESPLGSGYVADGRATSRVYNMHTYRAGGCSYYPGTDIMMVSCESGAPDYEGFLIHGDSVNLVNCKSFYAGQRSDSDFAGYGFHLAQNRFTSLSGCYAQDNRYSGFMFDGAVESTLVGCIADSNNTSSSGGAGFDFYAGLNNLISGCVAVDRNNAGTTTQATALRLRGSSTGNGIQLIHKGAGGATVTAPVVTDTGTAADGNSIAINGMGSVKTVTFAATITPDPYAYTTALIALTGAVTIAAPTYAHKGQALRFVFVQDATGGRVVTWNGVYKLAWTPTTTASKTNVIEFVYDGTSWVEVSGVVGI